MASKRMKYTLPAAEEQLASELQHLREEVINPPTYVYQVGERVQHGAITISHVSEILDDGKILRLHETVTEGNYGRPYTRERDIYAAWYTIEPWRDWSGESPVKTSPRFQLSYGQRDIEGLIHTYYHAGIHMDPDYQRGLVWSWQDKVMLIDSIFNDVDIGKFVLANLPFRSGHPSFEIIDGKQRLNALIDFREGRFTWRGKLYYHMHPRDRSHFDSYPVSVAILQEGVSRTTILECFIRLNTSGRAQDPKHINKVKSMLYPTRCMSCVHDDHQKCEHPGEPIETENEGGLLIIRMCCCNTSISG